MQIHRLGAGVFTIEGFLSPEECAGFIARSEGMGYAEAAIRGDDQAQQFKLAQGATVRSGVKYVLRTDVLYRRAGASPLPAAAYAAFLNCQLRT